MPSKMFNLTPREDLILLAARYNHPDYSWDQISQEIMLEYLELIPSEICQERYQAFLQYIEPNQCKMHYHPQKTSSFVQKKPSNFIFEYRQLREKEYMENDKLNLASVVRYEKKMISKYVYKQVNTKTKLIYKERKDKKGIERNKELLDILYDQIKQNSDALGILKQAIIEQKLEKILFDILQKTNDKISSEVYFKVGYPLEPISNLMHCIKLINNNHLVDERCKILQIYYEDQQLSNQSVIQIKSIIDYVVTLFDYNEIKIQNNETACQSTKQCNNEGSEYKQCYSNDDDEQGQMIKDEMCNKLSKQLVQDTNCIKLHQQENNISYFQSIYTQHTHHQTPSQKQVISAQSQNQTYLHPPSKPSNQQTFNDNQTNIIHLPIEERNQQLSFVNLQITISNQQTIIHSLNPSSVKELSDEVKEQVKQEVKQQDCIGHEGAGQKVDTKGAGIKGVRRVVGRIGAKKMVPKGCKVIIELKD